MRFAARMIATMAVSFLLVPALFSGDAAKSAAGAGEDDAGSSPAASVAVAEPLPAAPIPQSARADSDAPKADLFLGYSYWRAAPRSLQNRIAWLHGGDASFAYNLNRYLGIVANFSGYGADTITLSGRGTPPASVVNANGTVFTYFFGPRLSFRNHTRVTPFGEVLFGVAHTGKMTLSNCAPLPIGSCTALPSENSFAMTFGGGLDLTVHRNIAIRLIQADYLMTRFMDPSSGAGNTGTRNNVRLSAGIVFRFGSGGTLSAAAGAACSVDPAEVFADESVTATASGSYFNPKRTITYSWTGPTGKPSGNGASTRIDTAGLQPGSYPVGASLSDGSKNGKASCAARFTVKQPHPPAIACVSNPETVPGGGTATIRSTASSADNRRLTYGYSASAGNISGSSATTTLSTAGARPGPITVTCNVSDDRNPTLTASATTSVTVQVPPPPPSPAPMAEVKELEMRLALHSVYFQTARPTQKNRNEGLMESQQDVLTSLADDFKRYVALMPDAHLILGGHADLRGTSEYNQALTDRRVQRTKSFLVEHGTPAANIETRSFGKEDNLTVDKVKQLIDEDPDLSPADRQQMVNNLTVLVLANNRRVDVSLNLNGQQSTQRYPFNAKDYLALINVKN